MTPSAVRNAVEREAARQRGDPVVALCGGDPTPYSLARAIAVAMGSAEGGFEREVSDELRRGAPGGTPDRGGTRLPAAALLTTASTAGTELVFTSGRGPLAAPRPVPAFQRAGGLILPDHSDKLRVVQVAAGAQPEWVTAGEVAAAPVTPQDPTLDSEEPTPATALVAITGSRRLATAGPLAAMLENDLRAAFAESIDLGVFAGSGTNGEPYGMEARAGDDAIWKIDAGGAAITLAHVAEAEQIVGNADADAGPLAWVSSPNLRRTLRQTDRTATSGVPLWTDDNTIIGHDAFATSAVASDESSTTSTLFLGRWRQAIVAVQQVEIITDPIKNARQGMVEWTLYTTMSFALHRPAAFVGVLGGLYTPMS